jgi:hypothetical protein
VFRGAAHQPRHWDDRDTEQKNSHRSLCHAGTNLSATAIGTNIRNQSKENLSFIGLQAFPGQRGARLRGSPKAHPG